MSNSEHREPDEALLARLLHAAGRGPTASDEARQRIYRSVHAEWRSEVARANDRTAARRHGTRSMIELLGQWFWRGLPVAAAVAVAVVALTLTQNDDVVPRAELATVTKTVGNASLATSGSATALPLDAATTIVRTGDTVRTGPDGAVSLMLDNGLNLRLNSASEIVLASNDEIELNRGTVYLDSGASPDADTALEIATPFGTVWHRGTQYEARVGSNNLRIRVREGEIGFRDDAGELIGSAGEQLLISESSTTPLRTMIATTGADWAWVEDLASAPTADQYRVMDLLEWIARETGRRLEFANDTVATNAAAETLVGIAGLNPTETLEVLGNTTALRYELRDDSLLIY